MPISGTPITPLLEIELAVRVVLAFVLGAVIGYERETINRPAGLRTHMLVSAGSAAFTVASFAGMPGEGTVRDPGRIAAQVVAGVGFLGAGTIWRTTNMVRGLTTAASIWLVAAIGILSGSGLFLLAFITTVCGFATLRWGRPPSRRRRLLAGQSSSADDDDDDDREERIVD